MPDADGYRYMVLAVDHFTKYAVAEPVTNARTRTLISFLSRINDQLGPFERLLSDPGPQFRSNELKEFLRAARIQHDLSGRRHFEGNGCLERLVRTITETVAKLGATNDTWPTQLPTAIKAYNCRPHTTTGAEPYALFFKAAVKLHLDDQYGTTGPSPPTPEEVARTRDRTTSYWQQSSARRYPCPFREGDTVLHCPRRPTTLRHARDRRFLPRRSGPYFVIEPYPRNRYLLTDGYRQYLLPGWELQHYSV
ncbi:MAG: DDE-type integrase/transposase/recombinase [Chromatiaceae bacterium]|nr:DDE-type integrase/transposase/recombinase [Candidatus Thioaporhodococcus sediminis]